MQECSPSPRRAAGVNLTAAHPAKQVGRAKLRASLFAQLICVTVGAEPTVQKTPMTVIELSFAMLALLAAPGPTNTLLALAGAQGSTKPWTLPMAASGAYLATVLPLALWGHAWVHSFPRLEMTMTMLAGLWVGVLAARLWRNATRPLDSSTAGVTAFQIGTTTLLNPKALIFGLVLVPQAPRLDLGLGLFAILVLLTSAVWLGLGARLSRRLLPLFNRGGAVWLGLLAALMLGRALNA